MESGRMVLNGGEELCSSLKVKDLINMEEGCWDLSIIDEWLTPECRRAIIEFPLSGFVRDVGDKKVWPHEKNGDVGMKVAYTGWSIWKARCDFVFCGTKIDPLGTMIKAQKGIKEYEDCREKKKLKTLSDLQA
ncbi:hypothetical protein COLO4_13648 [Corchorus olitorius]|uniref:Uncharacterized protein n=1 Tax=Corchorus olitorius TaxID=93759 RepID=A0A1R3JW46_9ROSI|nr:hypothetical protein COLO4_13648 [Corchorus olitorius]